MRHFWHGFERQRKTASPVQFKRHVILVFWNPDHESSTVDSVRAVSKKYPSVKVKVVNVKKDPTKPKRFGVGDMPTILLLKDGREVSRVLEHDGRAVEGQLLEHLFQRAHV